MNLIETIQELYNKTQMQMNHIGAFFNFISTSYNSIL